MSLFSIHKTKKSLRRTARWFALLFIATTALTAVTPFLPSSPSAYAAGEEYVYYHPSDNELVRKLQENYDRGASDTNTKDRAEYKQTSVWMKGGIWEGQEPVRLTYDKDASSTGILGDFLNGGSAGFNDYVYSVSYRCDEGKAVRGGGAGSNPDNGFYQVKVYRWLNIDVDNNEGNRFFEKKTYPSKTKLIVNQYGPKPATTASGFTPDRVPKEVNPSVLPAACMPTVPGNGDTKYFWGMDEAARLSQWGDIIETDAATRTSEGVATEDEQPNCNNTGSPLGIVICPFIDGLAGVSDWIFANVIEGMLTNIPVGTDPQDPGFQAWQSFRLIANVVLVGALLAMVFAQSFGERFIDAYALRKMAPRILAGAILINLSIYIGVAAADITKVVGNGIGHLLTRPFVGGDVFDFTVGNSNALASVLQGLGILAGGALAGGGLFLIAKAMFKQTDADGKALSAGSGIDWPSLGMFLLLFILIPIILVALAVLITIAIRQGLLVLLIILAPIAFALYVLPGTEKYFRSWWSMFSKTLMVYPIIAVIFAMSDIMSALIFTANQNMVGLLTGTIVMFLPLFLIPFSFKFAGGAMSAVYGATQGAMNKGNLLARAQQGFTKSRQDKDSYFGKKAEAARLSRGERGLNAAKILGSGSEALGAATRRGGGGIRDRATLARGAYTSAYRTRETDHGLHAVDELMQRKDWQVFDGNDDMQFALQQVLKGNMKPHEVGEFLRTITYGDEHERAGQKVFSDRAAQDTEMAINRLMGGTTKETALTAATVGQFGTGTGWGSGYVDKDGNEIGTGGEAFAALSEAAGGNLSKLVGLNRRTDRELAKKAERPDLLPGFTDSMDGLQRYAEATIDASKGETERHYTDKNGNRVKWGKEELANWMVDSADRGHNSYQKYGQRKQSAHAFGKAESRRLKAAVEAANAGNETTVESLFANYADLNGNKEVLNSLPTDRRAAVTETLGSEVNIEHLKGVDVMSIPITETYVDDVGAQRSRITGYVEQDLMDRIKDHLPPGAKTATNQQVLDQINKGGQLWQRHVREWTASDQARAMGGAGMQPPPGMP